MQRFTDHQLKKILFAGILTLTLVAAGAVMAQGPGMGQGMRGRGMGQGIQAGFDGDFGFRGEFRLERMAARLGLTEEQTEAIAMIREEGRLRNLELRKETMRLRNEMKGEMLKDDPSQKKALELNAELGDLRTQRQANRLANRLAVRELLTPQQKDQMLMMGGFGQGNRSGHGGFQKGHRGAGYGNFGDFGRRGGQGRGFGPRFGGDPDCPNYNR